MCHGISTVICHVLYFLNNLTICNDCVIIHARKIAEITDDYIPGKYLGELNRAQYLCKRSLAIINHAAINAKALELKKNKPTDLHVIKKVFDYECLNIYGSLFHSNIGIFVIKLRYKRGNKVMYECRHVKKL